MRKWGTLGVPIPAIAAPTPTAHPVCTCAIARCRSGHPAQVTCIRSRRSYLAGPPSMAQTAVHNRDVIPAAGREWANLAAIAQSAVCFVQLCAQFRICPVSGPHGPAPWPTAGRRHEGRDHNPRLSRAGVWGEWRIHPIGWGQWAIDLTSPHGMAVRPRASTRQGVPQAFTDHLGHHRNTQWLTQARSYGHDRLSQGGIAPGQHQHVTRNTSAPRCDGATSRHVRRDCPSQPFDALLRPQGSPGPLGAIQPRDRATDR